MTKFLPMLASLVLGAIPATLWALLGLYFLTQEPFSTLEVFSIQSRNSTDIVTSWSDPFEQFSKFAYFFLYALTLIWGVVSIWAGAIKQRNMTDATGIGLCIAIVALTANAGFFWAFVNFSPLWVFWSFQILPILSVLYLMLRWRNVI